MALVLNDHGGGFIGAMSDDSNGDLMSVPQIRQALEDASPLIFIPDFEKAHPFGREVEKLLQGE